MMTEQRLRELAALQRAGTPHTQQQLECRLVIEARELLALAIDQDERITGMLAVIQALTRRILGAEADSKSLHVSFDDAGAAHLRLVDTALVDPAIANRLLFGAQLQDAMREPGA